VFARRGSQFAGRDLRSGREDAAHLGAPVVGANGGGYFFRRRLQINGLGPGFFKGGGAPSPSSAGHGGEGGWCGVDDLVCFPSRPAMEVRGL
jgi:hypothetical protein